MIRSIARLVPTVFLVPLLAHGAAAQQWDGPDQPQGLDRPGKQVSSAPQEESLARRPVVLAGDEETGFLHVDKQRLVLAGVVRGDVLAVDSDVTVTPGARVGGHLVAIGGTISNHAPDTVHVVQLDSRVMGSSAAWLPPAVPAPVAPAPSRRAREERPSWFQRQFALLVLGLLAALVGLIAVPRAMRQASAGVAAALPKSLAVGAASALALLFVTAADGALMRSPLRLFWTPIGTVLLIAILAVLVFGWLCGMRFVGDLLARVLQRPAEGSLYGRIALGLGAFFVANLILGRLNPALGAAGMVAEAGVLVLGLGAAVQTGFGSGPDWLTARLRGEHRWFPWAEPR